MSGFCIQRCMGTDTMNAVSVVSKDIDDAHGTSTSTFFDFFRTYRDKDQIAAAVMTDAKGDRSKRPHEQAIPTCTCESSGRQRRHHRQRCKGGHHHGSYCDRAGGVSHAHLTPDEKEWAVVFPSRRIGDNVTSSPSHCARERKVSKAPLND